MPGLEGTTLDHYQIQRRLGRGGMAEVYLAYDAETNQAVAIKILGGSQTAHLERFRREAEAIDKLHHDHILPAFDYGDEEPWHYLVMPYVPDGTLRDLLQKGPLTPEDAAELLDQIASALQFAHDHGIIHRDIKPSNILLQDDRYVYLADFGLAKTLEGTSELTQSGVLLGTPEYMAPDLADGPATASSDIYALGVLLYQMVAGRVPFVADTPVAVYWKQIREQPAPPSRVNPALTPAIDKVIIRALDKDPRRRFQSARELAYAYRQAVQEPGLPNTDEFPSYQEFGHPKRVEQSFENATLVPSFTPLTPQNISPHRFVRAARRMRKATNPRKLTLPNDPLAAPSAVKVKRKRMQLKEVGELPPLPMRQSDPVVQEPVSRPSGARRRPPEQVRKLNRLTTIIVAAGLLFFIVLPMSYLYYAYKTHSNEITTATTSSAINGPASNATTTQQRQATQSIPPTQQNQTTKAMAAQNTVLNSKPLLVDSLASDTPGRWTVDGTHCAFNNGSYHVTVSQANYLQYCPLLNPLVGNTAAQVDVSLLSGSNAGMLFRFKGDQYYDFEINSLNQFFFRRHDAGEISSSDDFYLLKETYSSAILPIGQKNTLLIIANGNDFKLYINGSFVGESQDSTYSSGQLALASSTLSSATTGQTSFANLKLFKAAQ